MKTVFGIGEDKMQKTSSVFTLSEIYQQPATWEKTCRQIAEHKDELKKFIDQVVTCEDFDIVLTGAGTSEFVGNALFPHLTRLMNHKVKSYGTTDIRGLPVPHQAHPAHQLRPFGQLSGVCRRNRCSRGCMRSRIPSVRYL